VTPRRLRWSLLSLALTVLLLAAPVASSAAKPLRAKARVGRLALTPPRYGRSSLLVEVGYPVAYIGHRVKLEVMLLPGRKGAQPIFLIDRALASGGELRAPERRRHFEFVHRIDLNRAQTRAAKGGLAVVAAGGKLDANGDGKPELVSAGFGYKELGSAQPKKPLCSSIPQVRARPGKPVVVPLPVCSVGKRWKLVGRPEHGRARIRAGKLIYRSGSRFRGTDSLALSGGVPAVFKVGATPQVVVRAMGDSVTAGFGYYDNGSPMPLLSLPECKPGSVTLVDPCSSNSVNVDNEAKEVEFAPDYGLSNNISWAAQWANEYGITNYENVAVSGAEPGQWAPGGPLYPITKRIESEDPDYILMTIGANPLLSEMLFGIDHMGCAIYADIFGGYKECIEEAFAKIGLHENLEHLYRDLVQKTNATIYLMQYHLSIPATALAYSSVQIAQMAQMMNAEIAVVAAAVNPKRLQVVTPPHFNVGVDLAPVYPSRYSCSSFGYRVDGPSVQIKATQDELLLSHPLSFCKGPVHGPPWVISGDTGIHPSATGYAQMASQVPPPSS
jgi:lysophospholipase L1-like esterase